MEKLKKSQVKELIDRLSFLYSCDLEYLKSYNYYLNKGGKLYLSKINLDSLNLDRVNSIGLYFGTIHDNDRFRLSIEGSKFISPKRNYIKLNEVSFKSYITGENLFKEEVEEINWEEQCPFLIVIYNEENLGAANVKDKNILCYVPKSRKLDFNKVF
ncbi:MAG: hypothetical protein KC589_02260 [Nanoarchaeota archaeon]|nr:hypothetical protein [Nanoarchaeota archaeon]